jgi:hypothetical protein
MKNHVLFFVGITGILVLFLSGCQKTDNEQTGRVIVKITDEPFPFELIEDASVTITRVEIRAAEAGEEEGIDGEDVNSNEGGSPFITLYEGSHEARLLELRNGVTEELADLEIPAGDYDLIRIYVENASISVKGYETYSVKVPSGSTTGVKVFIKPGLKVAGGLTTELLLDFSVARSFVLNGDLNTAAGIKGFNFKPVIRAVNNSAAGTIAGIITDSNQEPMANVLVTIDMEEEDITAQTNDEGYYAISGLPAGLYSLTVQMTGYIVVTANDVEVVEGNMTQQNFVMGAIPPVTP